MGKTYPVLITTKNGHRTRYWFRLRRFGLKYTGNGRYEGEKSKSSMTRIMAYCKRRPLKCIINNTYGTRSSNYRKIFFEAHPPTIFNGYFCSYCGFYIPKKKVSVDHLYPIGKASINLKLQGWLNLIGIDDINSPKNLIPSCKRCNRQKSANMGVWLFKGYLGKIQWLWYLRWALRLTLIIAAIKYLYYFIY